MMTIKALVKKFTPPFLLKIYHYTLALFGAIAFGFPSRKLTVIGVTGTSGKSTTVDFISRILEENGAKVASASSIKFKIGGREWSNPLKMTMPGRFAIQKFLKQAVKKQCNYAILEVTSEGIAQFRHKFINFNTAVFTNLSPEHIESHGGFENYRNEKLKLFKATKNAHVINVDDENAKYFLDIPAKKKYSFGINNQKADVKAEHIHGTDFTVNGMEFNVNVLGDFNAYNALGAISVAMTQGISLEICKEALEKVKGIPGRMEIVSKKPLVIVDYAHTPEQLESVYQSLHSKNLICVLGSCGGGRDKWKRPVLGQIAEKYCRNIIVTNEDPYDENPEEIINQVAKGANGKALKILDRREAIHKALTLAGPDDAVIITGKGSESLMCLENSKKIPWDDRQVTREEMVKISNMA